jgi:hypothetical protein
LSNSFHCMTHNAETHDPGGYLCWLLDSSAASHDGFWVPFIRLCVISESHAASQWSEWRKRSAHRASVGAILGPPANLDQAISGLLVAFRFDWVVLAERHIRSGTVSDSHVLRKNRSLQTLTRKAGHELAAYDTRFCARRGQSLERMTFSARTGSGLGPSW